MINYGGHKKKLIVKYHEGGESKVNKTGRTSGSKQGYEREHGEKVTLRGEMRKEKI